jgi:hypothetical protein
LPPRDLEAAFRVQEKPAPVQHAGHDIGNRDAVEFLLHAIASMQLHCVLPGCLCDLLGSGRNATLNHLPAPDIA